MIDEGLEVFGADAGGGLGGHLGRRQVGKSKKEGESAFPKDEPVVANDFMIWRGLGWFSWDMNGGTSRSMGGM